jgi:hypothetical protein
MKLNATDVIAGYAAVVATAALGWEVWKQRQARRLRVDVVVDGVLLYGPPITGIEWGVSIEVRNHGDHAVRVTMVGLLSQDDERRRISIPWRHGLPRGDGSWCRGRA